MFDLYKGSDLLEPLSGVLNLPLDQVNFVVTLLVAMVLGFIFRTTFSPNVVCARTRHAFEFTLGFSLLFFCFGLQTLGILLQSLVCYLIMVFFRPGLSEKLVFLFSMAFLGLSHVFRMYYDYAGYTLDVTGPLMINTMRMSALAFSYSDGSPKRTSNDLPEYVKKRSIKNLPSVLEMMSYSFSFHMVICGPFCFYHDYIAFIEGKNLESQSIIPQPLWPMMKKLFSGCLCLVLYLKLVPTFNLEGLLDPRIKDIGPVWYFLFYVIMATTVVRLKYYFAWKLADAVNLSAGLGYNGLDENGQQKWDLVDGVDILNVEFATNMKMVFGSWNKMTSYWLRHVVYERTRSTFAVFMTSAYWHGFYPGYYFSFANGAFFSILSRMVRQKVRASFQVSKVTSLLYDLLTIIVTKALISNLVVPFLLLELHKSHEFYMSTCYFVHIAGLVVFIVIKLLNLISRRRSKEL